MSEEPALTASLDTARAEQAVDAAGRAVADFASQVWSRVMKGVALAREEAEDIVAEARSMNQPPQG